MDIQKKIIEKHQQIDCIMIFKDNTLCSYIDTVVTLCNKYGLTLFASDLESTHRGVGIAYGITEYEYGVEAARLALQILEHNKKPADLSIKVVADYKLKINVYATRLQGLNIPITKLEEAKSYGAIII